MKRISFYAVFATIILIVACKRDFSEKSKTGDPGPGTIPRAVITSPPQIKILPVMTDSEYLTPNVIPGDHTQHMLSISYCESSPDRIYMAQDVSNIWVSKDFGQYWYNLQNQGLGTNFMVSVETDPLNRNRVVAAVQCRQYNVVDAGKQGIYFSEDGGISWNKAASRTKLGEVRSSTHLIAYAPSSKNATQQCATRWYAAFGKYNAKDDYTADDGLLTSNDGGRTFTEVRKLPAVVGNVIRGIKVHPQKPKVLYMYGDAGLFVFSDALNAGNTPVKLSNSSNLPDGAVYGDLYLSNNGDTMIVAVDGEGVYKTINGGQSWNNISANNSDNQYMRYCYVNKKSPNYIFAVPKQDRQQHLSISSNGGASWYKPQQVKYRPGFKKGWDTILNGNFSYVLPDPNHPQIVFMHSKSKNYRSVDAGKHWTSSDNGFNGASHIGAEQMFDPVHPNRFVYFMTDRGAITTTNKGKYFTGKPVQGSNWQSAIAGALQPIGGSQVIVASIGGGTSAQLYRSIDFGQNWNQVRPDNKPRMVVAFSLQQPDTCYQWRERSMDGGENWGSLGGMPDNAIICGVARSNGKVVYAIDNTDNGNKLYRSINAGNAWSTMITANWGLTQRALRTPGGTRKGLDKNLFAFCVDPQNEDIVYTSSADGQFCKWNLSVSTTTPTKYFNFLGPNVAVDDNFLIGFFAIDPRNPKTMYAINVQANTGNKFFRSNDGGDNWQNISRYIPQGSIKGLAVSPITGEVYISGENGSMVMLPPNNVATNTAYFWIPYGMNLLNSSY